MGVALQERWCGLLEAVRATLAIHVRNRVLVRENPHTSRTTEEQTRMTEGVLKSVIAIRDCRKLEASIRFIIRILQGADRDIFHDEYALVQREIKRMALVAKQLNRELLKVKRSRTPVPAM